MYFNLRPVSTGKAFSRILIFTVSVKIFFKNSKIYKNRENTFTNSKICGNDENIFTNSKIYGNKERIYTNSKIYENGEIIFTNFKIYENCENVFMDFNGLNGLSYFSNITIYFNFFPFITFHVLLQLQY